MKLNKLRRRDFLVSALLPLALPLSRMGIAHGDEQLDSRHANRLLFTSDGMTGIANVDGALVGGASLADHSKLASTIKMIGSQPWDFVILQDQSQIPSFRPEDVALIYLPHVESLVTTIHNNNPDTKIIYYVTWARRNGDSANCAYYKMTCTFADMTEALLSGYTEYQNATGGTLAKVGTAWKAVVEDKAAPFNSGELWQADDSHPQLRGSYLAAATIFEAVFTKSPVGLGHPQEISNIDASYLQQKAKATFE